MSVAEEIERLASGYRGRGPRKSVDAVALLRQRLPLDDPPQVVGVVGTNGKTSTATYLARLLSASGVRTGLYVSPHMFDWAERIRIDDVPCGPAELLETLSAVHGLAQSELGEPEELRFFDILTLAAELIFSRAEVTVAVFEAGIGGRLDAVRVLEPLLVLLTGVAVDHAEILGEKPSEILEEKLLVAPRGASVLTFSLGIELDKLVGEIAADRELRLVWVAPSAGEPLEAATCLRDALTLAEVGQQVAADVLGTPPPPPRRKSRVWPIGGDPIGIDLALPGRFECGERGEVPYVLDAAHNEAAWRLLVVELRRQYGVPPEVPPYTVLVSVSPSKRRESLADVLGSIPGLETVIVTRHTARPAEDPQQLAGELKLAGLDARAVEDVDAATALAFERADDAYGRVLVFGSTHLAADVSRWLSGVGAATGE